MTPHFHSFRIWSHPQRDYVMGLPIGEPPVPTPIFIRSDTRLSVGSGLYEEILPRDEYITELWTGLLTADGYRVHEGDIVEFKIVNDLRFDADTIIGEVFYEPGIFYFSRKFLFAVNDSNFNAQSLRVLGNIHQHPYLLK